jgi:hypothetical protein
MLQYGLCQPGILLAFFGAIDALLKTLSTLAGVSLEPNVASFALTGSPVDLHASASSSKWAKSAHTQQSLEKGG